MSESALIVDVLKKLLKSRGLTYRDLATRLRLSEASVKRVFANETFTLQRLEKICLSLDISVSELVRMASESSDSKSQYLTLAQEQALAANPVLLGCFYLLLNGHTSAEIQQRLGLGERELRALYARLDDAKLAESLRGLRARLRVGPVVSWRGDGPVRRVYEQQVKAEFLRSAFQGSDEALHFHSAELTDESATLLFRRLEQLAREFADLAALDRSLPTTRKRSVALLMAFRPWVFSMFDGLQKGRRIVNPK
jgi:DNA-binding Xre family transcriptional regulator